MIIAISIATVFAVGCKKKKQTVEVPKPDGEVLINEYCSSEEHFSDKKTFRATATGESLDRETAKKKARSNATAELAKTISNTMQVVGDNYVNSTEFNNTEEVTETFNEMARTIIDQEIKGAIKICDKLTQRPDGRYVSYIAIELSGLEVLQEYNEQLSKDERIKAEYNYEKFKDTFEEEMNRLRDN
jgi:ribulose bisphosphate carboxylase small subunit